MQNLTYQQKEAVVLYDNILHYAALLCMLGKDELTWLKQSFKEELQHKHSPAVGALFNAAIDAVREELEEGL